MKSNNPSSYGEDKTFPDGGVGGTIVGRKSYRSGFLTYCGSGTDKYNKLSMFTKNVCEDQNYLVLCICFPTTEG